MVHTYRRVKYTKKGYINQSLARIREGYRINNHMKIMFRLRNCAAINTFVESVIRRGGERVERRGHSEAGVATETGRIGKLSSSPKRGTIRLPS